MRLQHLLHIALFAALTVALSFVRVPLPISPVPVTGQTLATMLAGLMLGGRGGALSQLIYVLIGAVGLPVFGGLGGPSALMGPTGGYLIGMIVGAAVIGWMVDGRSNVVMMVVSCIVGGMLVVYIPGVLWLSRLMVMDLNSAVVIGVLPYLVGDGLKVVLAVMLAFRLRPIQSTLRMDRH